MQRRKRDWVPFLRRCRCRPPSPPILLGWLPLLANTYERNSGESLEGKVDTASGPCMRLMRESLKKKETVLGTHLHSRGDVLGKWNKHEIAKKEPE